MMIGSLSLRAKFLLTIVLGVVLPLAIAGLWLTRSTAHAGEALLHSELDASLRSIVATMRDRWAIQQGDLLLLERNAVIRDVLSKPAGSVLSRDDSAYLVRLATDVRRTFPSIVYRDGAGRVRWQFDRETSSAYRVPQGTRGPTVSVTVPVGGDGGASIGALEVRVLLSVLVPQDSLSVGIAGARLAILDRRTSLPLLVAPASALFYSLPDTARGLLLLADTLVSPPLIVTIAAPIAPYVTPFERAARLGLAVLMLVALGALLVSAFLATRTSGALRRMADAADAVATGDLERTVSWRGRDEIGRLASAFNTMTDSLRRTLNELSERRALAAVGEFAASLSHEVRNALTAIRVDLQHAERRLASGGKERDLVGRALTNVRRLDCAVTGSLRAARGAQAERTPVDVRHVVAAAMEAAESVFMTTGARVSVHAGSEPARVLGNAAALEQLFLNLLLNAGEALSAGGETRVSVAVDDGHVAISIVDTGVGMSAEALQRVGAPLFSSKTTGTGLGVWIATRIAEAHGGEVQLESEVGKGTTARVVLPRFLEFEPVRGR